MLSKQAQSVKDWLIAYTEFERTIDETYERYRRIESMVDIGAMRISDMPRGGGGGDRMTEYLSRKEELDAQIIKMCEQHQKDLEVIKTLLLGLEPEESKSIRLRHVAGMAWKEIIHEMYSGCDGYKEHHESYTRRAYRAYDSGIEKMAKHWSSRMS